MSWFVHFWISVPFFTWHPLNEGWDRKWLEKELWRMNSMVVYYREGMRKWLVRGFYWNRGAIVWCFGWFEAAPSEICLNFIITQNLADQGSFMITKTETNRLERFCCTPSRDIKSNNKPSQETWKRISHRLSTFTQLLARTTRFLVKEKRAGENVKVGFFLILMLNPSWIRHWKDATGF